MPTASISTELRPLSSDEVIASYIDAYLTERPAVPVHPDTSSTQAGDDLLERIDATLDLIARANRTGDRTLPIDRVDVSIVLPVFNCRDTLPEVLDRIDDVMPPATETIIVDDGSTDGSGHYAKSRALASRMTVIRRRHHHGRGSAIRLGIRHSVGHVVAIQDADLAFDPADLLGGIWPILEEKADAVYGSRRLRRDTPIDLGLNGWLNRIANWSATRCSNQLTGLRLSDLNNPQKVFRGDMVRRCRLTECGAGFDAEITAKIAARDCVVMEVPTHYDPEAFDDTITRQRANLWQTIRSAWSHRLG